jgi:hypothetical protein
VHKSANNQAARGVQFSFKVGAGTEAHSFANVVANWPGVLRVTQTFPDDSDDDLARLFVLEVQPSALVSTLNKLRRDPSVEYAEEPSPRKMASQS